MAIVNLNYDIPSTSVLIQNNSQFEILVRNMLSSPSEYFSFLSEFSLDLKYDNPYWYWEEPNLYIKMTNEFEALIEFSNENYSTLFRRDVLGDNAIFGTGEVPSNGVPVGLKSGETDYSQVISNIQSVAATQPITVNDYTDDQLIANGIPGNRLVQLSRTKLTYDNSLMDTNISIKIGKIYSSIGKMLSLEATTIRDYSVSVKLYQELIGDFLDYSEKLLQKKEYFLENIKTPFGNDPTMVTLQAVYDLGSGSTELASLNSDGSVNQSTPANPIESYHDLDLFIWDGSGFNGNDSSLIMPTGSSEFKRNQWKTATSSANSDMKKWQAASIATDSYFGNTNNNAPEMLTKMGSEIWQIVAKTISSNLEAVREDFGDLLEGATLNTSIDSKITDVLRYQSGDVVVDPLASNAQENRVTGFTEWFAKNVGRILEQGDADYSTMDDWLSLWSTSVQKNIDRGKAYTVSGNGVSTLSAMLKTQIEFASNDLDISEHESEHMTNYRQNLNTCIDSVKGNQYYNSYIQWSGDPFEVEPVFRSGRLEIVEGGNLDTLLEDGRVTEFTSIIGAAVDDLVGTDFQGTYIQAILLGTGVYTADQLQAMTPIQQVNALFDPGGGITAADLLESLGIVYRGGELDLNPEAYLHDTKRDIWTSRPSMRSQPTKFGLDNDETPLIVSKDRSGIKGDGRQEELSARRDIDLGETFWAHAVPTDWQSTDDSNFKRAFNLTFIQTMLKEARYLFGHGGSNTNLRVGAWIANELAGGYYPNVYWISKALESIQHNPTADHHSCSISPFACTTPIGNGWMDYVYMPQCYWDWLLQKTYTGSSGYVDRDLNVGYGGSHAISYLGHFGQLGWMHNNKSNLIQSDAYLGMAHQSASKSEEFWRNFFGQGLVWTQAWAYITGETTRIYRGNIDQGAKNQITNRVHRKADNLKAILHRPECYVVAHQYYGNLLNMNHYSRKYDLNLSMDGHTLSTKMSGTRTTDYTEGSGGGCNGLSPHNREYDWFWSHELDVTSYDSGMMGSGASRLENNYTPFYGGELSQPSLMCDKYPWWHDHNSSEWYYDLKMYSYATNSPGVYGDWYDENVKPKLDDGSQIPNNFFHATSKQGGTLNRLLQPVHPSSDAIFGYNHRTYVMKSYLTPQAYKETHLDASNGYVGSNGFTKEDPHNIWFMSPYNWAQCAGHAKWGGNFLPSGPALAFHGPGGASSSDEHVVYDYSSVKTAPKFSIAWSESANSSLVDALFQLEGQGYHNPYDWSYLENTASSSKWFPGLNQWNIQTDFGVPRLYHQMITIFTSLAKSLTQELISTFNTLAENAGIPVHTVTSVDEFEEVLGEEHLRSYYFLVMKYMTSAMNEIWQNHDIPASGATMGSGHPLSSYTLHLNPHAKWTLGRSTRGDMRDLVGWENMNIRCYSYTGAHTLNPKADDGMRPAIGAYTPLYNRLGYLTFDEGVYYPMIYAGGMSSINAYDAARIVRHWMLCNYAVFETENIVVTQSSNTDYLDFEPRTFIPDIFNSEDGEALLNWEVDTEGDRNAYTSIKSVFGENRWNSNAWRFGRAVLGTELGTPNDIQQYLESYWSIPKFSENHSEANPTPKVYATEYCADILSTMSSLYTTIDYLENIPAAFEQFKQDVPTIAAMAEPLKELFEIPGLDAVQHASYINEQQLALYKKETILEKGQYPTYIPSKYFKLATEESFKALKGWIDGLVFNSTGLDPETSTSADLPNAPWKLLSFGIPTKRLHPNNPFTLIYGHMPHNFRIGSPNSVFGNADLGTPYEIKLRLVRIPWLFHSKLYLMPDWLKNLPEGSSQKIAQYAADESQGSGLFRGGWINADGSVDFTSVESILAEGATFTYIDRNEILTLNAVDAIDKIQADIEEGYIREMVDLDEFGTRWPNPYGIHNHFLVNLADQSSRKTAEWILFCHIQDHLCKLYHEYYGGLNIDDGTFLIDDSVHENIYAEEVIENEDETFPWTSADFDEDGKPSIEIDPEYSISNLITPKTMAAKIAAPKVFDRVYHIIEPSHHLLFAMVWPYGVMGDPDYWNTQRPWFEKMLQAESTEPQDIWEFWGSSGNVTSYNWEDIGFTTSAINFPDEQQDLVWAAYPKHPHTETDSTRNPHRYTFHQYPAGPPVTMSPANTYSEEGNYYDNVGFLFKSKTGSGFIGPIAYDVITGWDVEESKQVGNYGTFIT